MVVLWIAAIVLFIVIPILASAIKITREYERGVIFRLGRFIGIRGPGIFLIIPIIDSMVKVDLRIVAADVPRQRVVTKDNVTVDVDAIVYYKIFDPAKAIINVEDYSIATSFIAQTTLRDVLGQVELDYLLQNREELNKQLQKIIDEATEAWGVKVTGVTIRDVILPEAMLRAMAKQAEAERERRSRIIMAEGEYQASKKMAEAAKFYEEHPVALRLRELQTLSEIAREKNLIIASTGELGLVAGLSKKLQEKSK